MKKIISLVLALVMVLAIPDFYLHQECGTPIDDNTVDSTKI